MRPEDPTNLLASALEAWLPEQVRRWYTVGTQRAIARESVSVAAKFIGNTAFGAEFRDNIGVVDVADPAQWTPRIVELPDGNWFAAAIHFMGLDPAKPFINIVATSLPPQLDVVEAAAGHVLEDFSAFNPIAARVHFPNPPPDADVDLFSVAGLVSTLREKPRVRRYEEVRLVPADPADVGVMLRRMRGEEDKPETRTWAQKASDGALEQCAEEGLLFHAVINNERAGVIAAERDHSPGVRGFEVIAHTLDPAFRGRGYSSAVMQRLVDELPALEDDSLWGTIAPGNLPSLRSALGIGREIIGAYVWLGRRGEI